MGLCAPNILDGYREKDPEKETERGEMGRERMEWEGEMGKLAPRVQGE